MGSRESRRVPQEVRQASQKSEVIDFNKKQATREREKTGKAKEGVPHRDQKKPLTEDEREQRAQVDQLNDQLRFLAKRLGVSQDTVRDPNAVQQLDKSYREILNQMNKTVAKFDSVIKPLRSEIKRDGKAVEHLQKEYEKSSGIAKFIRTLFPALDAARHELSTMRASLEEKKKKLNEQEKERSTKSSSEQTYREYVGILRQAEGIINELDSIAKKSA